MAFPLALLGAAAGKAAMAGAGGASALGSAGLMTGGALASGGGLFSKLGSMGGGLFGRMMSPQQRQQAMMQGYGSAPLMGPNLGAAFRAVPRVTNNGY